VTDPAITLAGLRAFASDPERVGEPFLGRYTVWESSGSSGEPALFVQDAAALAVGDALEAARGPASLGGTASWAWGALGEQRLAYVAALDGHFAGIVSLVRARRLNPWVDAATRTFSFLQPMRTLVAELNEHRPTVLATYPSMAWVLSEEQAAGRLHIEPQVLWTGGETLTAPQRAALSQRFHAPVRNMYGASECLTLASDCRCGRLHLNADWAILEPVDAHGHAVPDGQTGATTLLTNLANHVQPILRYDLGDRVRFVPGACPCGSPLPVIEVEGRSDDVLELVDRDGRAVYLSPLALTTVLEDHGGVFDFELRQDDVHTLHLTLHGRDAGVAAQRRAATALRQWLRTQGVETVRLHTRSEAAPCGRGLTGKQRRIRRLGAARHHATT
jgi:phenylacetate-coenzyme A ligase PaaK-like adenylate-forming protein